MQGEIFFLHAIMTTILLASFTNKRNSVGMENKVSTCEEIASVQLWIHSR